MALSIPVEIWLLIASYVGKEDHDKLINVNSIFFNIVMDNRYRKVYIKYIDSNDHMRRKLLRLCDPFVAPRVRQLHVDPIFDPYTHLHGNQAKRDHWGFFKRLKSIRRDSTQSPLQSLLTAVKCMSNVSELTLYGPDPASKKLKSFLPIALSSFGPSLKSLTLGRTLPSVKKLVLSLTASPATRLVALEELCLEFGRRDWYNSISETRDSVDMGRVVAPFVNKLAPQLRCLSISSWSERLDLCPLFSTLDPYFPALHHFSIRAPFRPTWSSSPNALASFLRHHSKTIRSADLVFLPCVSDNDYLNRASYYEYDEEVLASWLKRLSADPVVLSGLHSLKIYPTYSSQSGFNAVVSLARRSAETLSSLSILARYLTHEEVTAIVSVFSANRSADSRNLVTLRLNLRRLDPQIIRLLATNLPGLKEVGLRLMWLRNGSQERNEITALSMRGHYYPDWGLHDLGIWNSRGKVDESILRLVAKSVPSIKSFWGEC